MRVSLSSRAVRYASCGFAASPVAALTTRAGLLRPLSLAPLRRTNRRETPPSPRRKSLERPEPPTRCRADHCTAALPLLKPSPPHAALRWDEIVRNLNWHGSKPTALSVSCVASPDCFFSLFIICTAGSPLTVCQSYSEEPGPAGSSSEEEENVVFGAGRALVLLPEPSRRHLMQLLLLSIRVLLRWRLWLWRAGS